MAKASRRAAASLGRWGIGWAACLLLAPLVGRAQGIAYCNITSIETQRLANAVQVTIRADGALQTNVSVTDFYDIDALSAGKSDWKKSVSVLPLQITNARSQVGNFADVGAFPVSHVELSIPQNAVEGIGLDLRVVMFTPVQLRGLKLGGMQWMLGGETFTRPTVSMETSPDQRSIVILVTRDLRAIRAQELRKPPAGAPATLNVTQSPGGRVSVDALNVDLRALVREIGRQTHRPIAVDDAVDHVVSLYVEDAGLDEIVDGLAAAYNLTVGRDGPAIRLAESPANRLVTYGESVYERIPVSYLSAAAARAVLPEFMLRYVHLDEGGNALTAFGPKPLVEKLRRDLARIDRPVPHVEIEATTVEFSSSSDLEAVLDQSAQDRTNSLGVLPGTGDIAFSHMGGLARAYEANLHALEASGRAHVRSRSRVVALNGQSATLFAGQQRYIKVNYYDMNYGTYDAKIMSVDVGASVEVTPWTGGGGDITVRVAPSVSDIADVERGTGLPTVATRKADATLRVHDGDTVVIGGLSQDQRERTRQRIPLLGDLPLVGWVFQAPRRSRSRTELAMFLKARIVTGVKQ